MDIHQGGAHEVQDAEQGAEGKPDPQAKTLEEIRGDIEASLFAVQDLTGRSDDPVGREKAIIATKLEEAFLWTKRAIEKGEST